MKHFSLCRALVLSLTVLTLLTACGSSLHKVVPVSDSVYRDTKTDSTYRVLPSSYEPISRGAEVGKLDLSGVSYILHEITGLDSASWLCTAYGDVYCAEDASVPTFDTWSISAVHVCTNTAVSVAELSIKPNALYSTEVCEKAFSVLQTAYRQGQAVSYPSYAELSRIYLLRFESPDAPGLYYTVRLLEYAEDIYESLPDGAGGMTDTNVGRVFLHDRYAGRCVPVNPFIFRMLDGQSAEEALP